MDIANGFLLGLSTGINCLIICCPYLFPFFLAEIRPIKKNLFLVIEYLSGRLFAYIILAILSNMLGVAISEFDFSAKIYSIFLMLSSILLFLYCFGLTFEFKFLNTKIGLIAKRVPFFVGFLNGFNFCPPLITAFSYSVAAGNIYKSIIFFCFIFFRNRIIYFTFYFF